MGALALVVAVKHVGYPALYLVGAVLVARAVADYVL